MAHSKVMEIYSIMILSIEEFSVHFSPNMHISDVTEVFNMKVFSKKLFIFHIIRSIIGSTNTVFHLIKLLPDFL